jgi:hypothetical protein
MQHPFHFLIIINLSIAAPVCNGMHKTLLSHDCGKEPIDTTTLHWDTHFSAFIAHHPTEKDVILFPSAHHTLSIQQQLKSHPHLQQHLLIHSPWSTSTEKLLNDNNEEIKISSGEYNPEGAIIAIHYNNNKYCMYNLKNNDPFAYELSADNKKYVGLAFHPHTCLVALLSLDKHKHPADIVHYWNYKSRVLVATTHPLREGKTWPRKYRIPEKKLFFINNGKNLACSIYKEWDNLDTPCTNLVYIWNTLRTSTNLLPEVIAIIIHKIIDTMTHKGKLSYIDLIALSRITPLVIPFFAPLSHKASEGKQSGVYPEPIEGEGRPKHQKATCTNITVITAQ